MTDTKTKVNLAMSCPAMFYASSVPDAFSTVDATALKTEDAKERENYFIVLKEAGKTVSSFRMEGNKDFSWLMVLKKYDFSQLIPNVRELTLVDVPFLGNLSFLERLPKLKSLTLDQIRVNPDDYLHFLPRIADRIESLAIPNNISLNMYDMVYILQYFQKAKYVDVTGCTTLTAGTVGTILTKCPLITTFYFSPRYSVFEARKWMDLVEHEFIYVEFADKVYEHIVDYREDLREGGLDDYDADLDALDYSEDED